MGWICLVCTTFGLALSLAGSQPCTPLVCNGGTCTNGTDGNFVCGPCPQNKTGTVCLDDALSGPERIYSFSGSNLSVRCDILTKERYNRVQWEYNGNRIARYFPAGGLFYDTDAFQNKTLTYNHTTTGDVTVSVLIIADRDKEYGNYVCDIDTPSTARRLVPVIQGMAPNGTSEIGLTPPEVWQNQEFTVNASAPCALPAVTLVLIIQQDSTNVTELSTNNPCATRSTDVQEATVNATFTPRTASNVTVRLIADHPSYESPDNSSTRIILVRVPPPISTDGGLHPGAIAGIVIGVLVGLALICGLVAFAVKNVAITASKNPVTLGEKVTLTCPLNKCCISCYVWKKSGKPLSNTSRITIDQQEGTLEIKGVVMDDEGVYCCSVGCRSTDKFQLMVDKNGSG